MFATRTSDDARAIASALRDADASIAKAIDLIGRTDIESETGLSSDIFLTLEARCTGPDARVITKVAATLRMMPLTKAAFDLGKISWGQVRAIISSVRHVEARTEIDGLVHDEASRGGDPDELLARVDDKIARIRSDLSIAREDRAIERSFLAVQARLDGGSSFYGEADAESSATILEALDAAADDPVDTDADGAPSRARQRLHALVRISEAFLDGGATGRARPRLIATVNVDALAQKGHDSARILWSLAGRPARLTGLATETMLCDATVIPVAFDGARPVAVGDAQTPITRKLRTTLAARDGGCRFPGCRAPVAWCDAHHVRARIQDGPTVIDNLLLLCRRCHRRVHRFRWRITLQRDGTIEFRRQGQTYSSTPRARLSPRE